MKGYFFVPFENPTFVLQAETSFVLLYTLLGFHLNDSPIDATCEKFCIAGN
jgi:hypothetical protein